MSRHFESQIAVTVAVVAITLGMVQETTADCIPANGNLADFLMNVPIPGSGSHGFLPPPAEDIAAWGQVIETLVTGDCDDAADLAADQGYDLYEYADVTTGLTYHVLVEQTFGGQPLRGLGTYVYNPSWTRALNLQAPHASFDTNTRAESIAMFLELRAAFLQIAGTHRCANPTASACSGMTTACSEPSQPYRISDVAHYVDNFFQETSNAVSDELPVVTVSVHGFGPCEDWDSLDVSIVQISNGTTGAVSNSLATQLAAAYNVVLVNLPNPYPGAGAGSFNVAPGEPAELQQVGCPDFHGNTNTQGRYINGEMVNPCMNNVANAPLPERFIHIEQQLSLREPPDDQEDQYPDISWQITIDVFAAVFDDAVWVDFDHTGIQNGGFLTPFNSLFIAVAAAGPGQTVYVKPGSTDETITIDDDVILRSFGGSAVIGLN